MEQKYYVRELLDNLIPLVDAFLRRDLFVNAYAIWDLYKLRHRTKFFVCLESGKVVGLLLDYSDYRGNHYIWLWGDENVVTKLLEVPLPDRMVFCIPPELEGVIKRKFSITSKYPMDFMILRKGDERLYIQHEVKQLSMEDACALACLRRGYSSEKDVEIYRNVIREALCYGIFINSNLISVACASVRLPEIWILGGFYTHPEHRNKGYATTLASFLVREAFKETNYVGLYVRADNYPAKRVYEKVGFKPYKRIYWLDCGTGLIP